MIVDRQFRSNPLNMRSDLFSVERLTPRSDAVQGASRRTGTATGVGRKLSIDNFRRDPGRAATFLGAE
jgi:hypothetical protein